MLNKFENYRFEGEMHRVALMRLRAFNKIDGKDKDELIKACKYGRLLGMGIQFPVILGAMLFFNRVVPKFTPEVKMVCYTLSIGFYGMFFMFTKSWAWHQAFNSVEPIVANLVLKADIEDLKEAFEEQSLEISKDKNIYVPNTKE